MRFIGCLFAPAALLFASCAAVPMSTSGVEISRAGGAVPLAAPRALPAPAPEPVVFAAGSSWPQKAQARHAAGLPNLHRVSDNLYRGGKPNSRGFKELKAMGVRTVVDLGYWPLEIDRLKDPMLNYEHIPFYTWKPKDADVVRFLRIVSEPSNGIVYLHCRKGADRTGFMIAIYRVAVGGWSREQAISEMTRGGFGFDPTYQNLISYIRTRDLNALARQAGLSPAATAFAGSNW